MEQRDYTGLVPLTPPDGLETWTLSNAPELQYDELIYKVSTTGNRRVEVWCSCCGGTTEAIYIPAGCGCGHNYGPGYGFRWEQETPTLYDGKEAACPRCGKSCKVRHCSHVGRLGTAWPLTVHKIEPEGAEPQIAVVWWSVCREAVKVAGGYVTEVEINPYEAYVVEKRKLVRLKSYYKGIGYAFAWLNHWHQTKSTNDYCGRAELVYPWDARLLEGTVAENCKLDLYLKTKDSRPVQYLSCWTKHRNVENLIVQGFGKLFTAMIEDRPTYSYSGGVYKTWKNIREIDWKQKRPSKMLGLTREETRYVKSMKLTPRELTMWRALKEHGIKLKLPEELEMCRRFGTAGVTELAEDGRPVMKIVRYINRQIEKYPRDKSRIALSTLEDYWKLAKKVGEQLRTDEERYPQHLVAAHDAMLARVKFKESEELKEGFRKQFERLSAYSFTADGLLIRPVRDEQELIFEGKALHHCVATYAKTHSQGERVILLIRRQEEPEVPFYTLNLNTKTLHVIQNHGAYNKLQTDEVKAFETKWLEYIMRMNAQKERKTA